MIYIYRFLINLVLLFSPLIILIRFLKNKEDPKRFLEKFTFFSKRKKMEGKLIWFHAASVGELLSIISLVKKLEKNKKISQILITTSTLTSSKLFFKFKFKKTIHQFFPIDTNFFSKRFLNHWKPDLAIFVESEIWPNMLINLKKKSIKRILLNARISKKSFRRWKVLGTFSESLFQIFDFTFPQNNESKTHLKKLKVKNIKHIGNLKFSQNYFQKNNLDLKFKNFIKSRKVWCAASTHKGEEEICTSVHTKLLEKYKNLLLILIPRHVERVNNLQKDLSKFNHMCHIHSDKSKINKKTKIYIVDTYGEANLFFNISKNIFIGKSLTNDGGQNPLEAARSNCNIIHGPHVSNFTEIYNFLGNLKISFEVKNKDQLYKKLETLLKRKSGNIKIQNKINVIGINIFKKNLIEIEKFI